MIHYKFTNDYSPADTKDATPIYKVSFTDTAYTVKSDGIQLDRYLLTDSEEPDFTSLTNLTFVDTLYTNIIGFYSDDGSMLGFHYSDNFALKYTGKFYAEKTGYYKFNAIGYGFLKVYINNQQYIIGSDVLYQELSPIAYNSGHYYLTGNTWYDFEVKYYTTYGESGFSLLYTLDTDDEFVPVSAGVVSYKGSFIQDSILPDVISVSHSESIGEVSTLTFDLPLVTSGSSESGYYFNTYWQKYCHTQNDIALDKFRLIEFEAGYSVNNTDNYIKKFIGHIESFTSKRANDSTLEVFCKSFENLYKQALNFNYPDKYDYWNAGYGGALYSTHTPDGIGTPPTFDGWELHEVVKVMSIRAGIDSTLLTKKKTFLDSNDLIVSGTSLIEKAHPMPVVLDTQLNYGNSIVVNKDIGSVSDDPYIIKSNFGDTLYDYLNTITDVYGWYWGNNAYYDGAPYLQASNNPSNIIDVNYLLDSNGYGVSYISTNTPSEPDISTISGKYFSTNAGGDGLTFYFKGIKANLIVVKGNQSGSEYLMSSINSTLDIITTVDTPSNLAVGNIVIIETVAGDETRTITGITGKNITLDSALSYTILKDGYIRTATFKAELRRGQTWSSGVDIQTTYHSNYYNNSYNKMIHQTQYKDFSYSLDTKRFYYDGIDPTIGKNPCVINLVNDLSYDFYMLKLTRLSNSEVGNTNYMLIDALAVYDTDIDQIVQTFYTGDSVASGTVINMDIKDSGENLRNDTIVVGSRIGVDVPGSDTNRPLNPNNPTNTFLISRATDLHSIYDPNVTNYIGMPRQTIQIAPEVSSMSRATYWAISFLNKYRKSTKYPEFSTLGNPLIEQNDCIAIYDEGRSVLNTYDKFWVEGISSTYSKNNYISKITTKPYEPWESYTRRIPFDLSYTNNKYISNVTIVNGGNSKEDSTSNNITTAFDPYSTDEDGTKVIIKYNLNVDSYVRIDIYPSERPDLKVATLLNPTGSNGPEGWQKQQINKNYVVTWDGVDVYGDWNKYCTENATEKFGKGYYVHEGLYPTNGKGKFYVRFSIIKLGTINPSIYVSYDDDILGSSGYIYTQRANVSSLNLSLSPKFINTGAYFAPQVCFSDSNKYGDEQEALKLYVEDTTDYSFLNSFWRIQPSPTSVKGYVGLGLPFHNERNLANRKVQLKIVGYNVVVIMGEWVANGQTRRSYKVLPIWEDTYYDDQSFKHYGSGAGLIKYISPVLFNYSYNYKQHVSEDWFNTIEDNNGKIYMGWYIYIEVISYDKSGRRVIVTVPSNSTSDYKYNKTGNWMFWLDDIEPKPPKRTGSSDVFYSNSTGYNWAIVHADALNLTLTDSKGNNIIDDTVSGLGVSGLGGVLNLVQVYPKEDYYGNTWGY